MLLFHLAIFPNSAPGSLGETPERLEHKRNEPAVHQSESLAPLSAPTCLSLRETVVETITRTVPRVRHFLFQSILSTCLLSGSCGEERDLSGK